MSIPCPFCDLPLDRVVNANTLAIALLDGFPVSHGHTLITPKRHVQSWFDATPAEQHAMLELLTSARLRVEREHAPAGYNIGINDGPAAGQTVMHLHLHLIPRYDGDSADPRGGVRWVIPDRAAYWSK